MVKKGGKREPRVQGCKQTRIWENDAFGEKGEEGNGAEGGLGRKEYRKGERCNIVNTIGNAGECFGMLMRESGQVNGGKGSRIAGFWVRHLLIQGILVIGRKL